MLDSSWFYRSAKNLSPEFQRSAIDHFCLALRYANHIFTVTDTPPGNSMVISLNLSIASEGYDHRQISKEETFEKLSILKKIYRVDAYAIPLLIRWLHFNLLVLSYTASFASAAIFAKDLSLVSVISILSPLSITKSAYLFFHQWKVGWK